MDGLKPAPKALQDEALAAMASGGSQELPSGIVVRFDREPFVFVRETVKAPARSKKKAAPKVVVPPVGSEAAGTD